MGHIKCTNGDCFAEAINDVRIKRNIKSGLLNPTAKMNQVRCLIFRAVPYPNNLTNRTCAEIISLAFLTYI
jgi:hypothetical protein